VADRSRKVAMSDGSLVEKMRWVMLKHTGLQT
jgi:hypothetical protein